MHRVTLQPSSIAKSPAFQAAYPQVVNADLIEAGAKQAMEVSWNRGQFQERDIKVFRVRDAYVVHENLVLDHNLQPIENIDDGYSQEEIDGAIQVIQEREAAKTLPYHGEIGVVAKRRAVNNYGHYLLYMLPLAILGKLLFGEENPRYLVHRVSPAMIDVQLRALRLAGISLDRMLVPDWSEPMRFAEVVFFTGVADHGTYLSPLAVSLVNEIATTIPEGKSRKLFVRRAPGWRRRDLHNSDDIERRLIARGFEVIEPGSTSLEQQIHMFKGADCVVGAIGAAMTNIVFCKLGARIVMLCPSSFPDTFFWFIATHRQLEYVEIRGDLSAPDTLPDSWEGGFTIREGDIQWLESLATDHTPSEPRGWLRRVADTVRLYRFAGRDR